MSNNKTKQDARAEKRAAALRDNLRRRKEASQTEKTASRDTTSKDTTVKDGP